MATIKDVAKLAGVSHGTVSNIINGVQTVNSEIVKRVEIAMQELGYQPDAKARSLRNNKSNHIGIVLPNIVDDIYTRIYAGIEKATRQKMYALSLYTTGDVQEQEEEILKQIQQQRLDGVILITCMPENMQRFNQLKKAGIELVFVRRKPVEMYDNIYLSIDEKSAVQNATKTLLQKGMQDIVFLYGRENYSNETDCLAGFYEAMEQSNNPVKKNITRSIELGKENAFRAVTWWMQSGNLPEAIVTTCSEFSKGAKAAIQQFGGEHHPLILYLDNISWSTSVEDGLQQSIGENYSLLGHAAASKLIDVIKSGKTQRNECVILNSAHNTVSGASESKKTVSSRLSRPLRVLMMENAASYASQLMVLAFRQKTNIQVEIDILPYNELYAHMLDTQAQEQYDVVQVNVSWFREMARSGRLMCLDEHLKSNHLQLHNFTKDLLDIYSMDQGKLYSIPFMLDTQMLFYRKDLFADMHLQRLFYEQNKSPLQVPRTWQEYDIVAKFFTKHFNPDSPVPYGTTMGGDAFYSVYGFLPRLWELGGDILSLDGDFSLDPEVSAKALEEYVAAFQYADPASVHWNWTEQTKLFCQGKAAMMVIYQAHFTDHQNRYRSIVDGKVGYSPLPGQQSILGGWSLGINPKTELVEQAIAYISSVSSTENAIPNNILGGSIPGKTVLESIEMQDIYPWFLLAYQQLKSSRMMLREKGMVAQWMLEEKAGNLINQCIVGEISADEAVLKMREQLRSML